MTDFRDYDLYACDIPTAELEASEFQRNYISKIKAYKRHIIFARIFILAAFLFLWEYAVSAKWIDAFFFSSPSRIVSCFLSMAKDFTIFRHIGITLFETIASFLLVILISLLVTIILWYFKKLSEIVEPFLVVLNSLPKSALAPLFIVWLGSGIPTIIVAGISVAIFGSIINLYTGFHQVDEDKIKLIHTLGGTKWHVLTKVVIPSNLPTILSNMKVNIGLSLVGVVIGEFIGAREGLGYLIIYGSQVFKLDWVIMSIVILCLVAVSLYQGITLIEKWYERTI
ncbi:MAG: ABC transporter permease [Roseburia sp.]|nr:ABC transporter permease [Roseburia sp.]